MNITGGYKGVRHLYLYFLKSESLHTGSNFLNSFFVLFRSVLAKNWGLEETCQILDTNPRVFESWCHEIFDFWSMVVPKHVAVHKQKKLWNAGLRNIPFISELVSQDGHQINCFYLNHLTAQQLAVLSKKFYLHYKPSYVFASHFPNWQSVVLSYVALS